MALRKLLEGILSMANTQVKNFRAVMDIATVFKLADNQ
jgi:hypothetical protein